jgi:hypothetical protein
VPLGGVVVAGGGGGVEGTVAGGGAVGGEAAGVRSAGRSPTRSVPVSLQAVSNPRLSATAQKPVSILFIAEPPPCGVAPALRICNGDAVVRSLDRAGDNY